VRGVARFTENYDAGALARARAGECCVPDPERVIRVTFDGVPVFHYDDDRPAFEPPTINDAGEDQSRR
jgi:hypothetical protein